MSDTEMDFHTYVAPHYEVRRPEELPAAAERSEFAERYNFRYLLQVDKPRLVRPKRKALNFAIGLLLKFPKQQADPKAEFEPPAADEIVRIERNVLAIAKQIGLLYTSLTPHRKHGEYRNYGEARENQHESILDWLTFAWWIQSLFAGDWPVELPIGSLNVYLAHRPGGSSAIAVRPTFTREALAFHAAQMIAKGTTSRTCEHCGTTFLSGGRGEERKRGGSRFCSDECRYRYHNEQARRRKHK